MISDIFTMSLDALRSRKIRTFLTLLGVIIGTGSVIIVATAGSSLKVYVKEQWNVFDPTGIIIGVGTASKTDCPLTGMGFEYSAILQFLCWNFLLGLFAIGVFP
jgi:ABC-type antimicrobial peptide transport system permease subunit